MKMEIRRITDSYAVSPQISPEDCSALAAEGFTTVICNRPDTENPPELHSAAVEAAAQAAGLTFVDNPISGGGISQQNVALQKETVDAATGPVFAYCRTGTRSTYVWAFGAAGTLPSDEIISAAGQAGYDLAGLRGQLDQMAGR